MQSLNADTTESDMSDTIPISKTFFIKTVRMLMFNMLRV